MISPSIVNIELCNYCNAHCHMCTYDIMKRKKGFMSWETFKIIANKLSEIDTIENIQLHGHGESFLHKDINFFANYIKRICPNKTISLFTNGVFVNEIPEGFDNIVVSFNGGNKETYEKMMGLNFEYALEKIQKITPKNKVLIQMLLCKDNIDSKEDFEKLWCDWKYSMHDGYYNWAGNIPYNGLREPPTNGICKRLFLHMSIHWNGIVNLCTQDYEQQMPIGSLITNSVENIYNNFVFAIKREEQKRGIWTDLCNDCSYSKWEHFDI